MTATRFLVLLSVLLAGGCENPKDIHCDASSNTWNRAHQFSRWSNDVAHIFEYRSCTNCGWTQSHEIK